MESSSITPFQNTGRPPATNRFKVGVAIVAVLTVVGVGVMMKRSAERGTANPLSAAERAELAVQSTTEGKLLVHPELGFRLRHPGELYFVSREAEDKLAAQFDDDSTRFYALAEMKTGNMLYLTLSKRPGLDADGFADMVDTVTHVFTQQTSTRLGEDVAVETAERSFDHAQGRAKVHKVLAGGRGHVRVGAWKTTFGRGVDYVVVLAAVTQRADALAPVIDSFRLR